MLLVVVLFSFMAGAVMWFLVQNLFHFDELITTCISSFIPWILLSFFSYF
jgi:multisubunit Na+/H+ antiporter MnhE subunit